MRVDGLFQNQSINLSNLAGVLERANVGDVIRAQILEITSDELVLKLFDGSTVNASTSETKDDIDAKRGDFLELKVKDKQDNKIVLEQIKNNSIKKASENEDITRQVKALGLLPDSENLEIANEIKSNNLPLTKETFDKIVEAVIKFKDINPSKAAFLLASKLGIEEKNVSALKQVVDEKVKISQGVENLLDSLDKINDESVLKSIASKIIPNIKDGGTQGENTNPRAEADISQKNITNLTQNKEKTFNDINTLIDEALKQNGSKGLTEKKTSEDLNILNKIKNFFEYNKSSTDNITDKFTKFVNRSLGGQEKQNFQAQDSLLEVTDKIVSLLKEFEKQEKSMLPKNNLIHDNPEIDLSNPDDVKKAIKNIFEKLHINIDSENLKEELNVKKLYKDLYSKLDIIRDTIDSSLLQNKTEILTHIDNLENNMKFMNQLSSYNTYIQIPLNVWNKNTTGELYILKRDSKRKKIDPDNTTMFISLNTENIGQVDTLVGVSKKNINVNMRVESQNIIDFIKGYHKELYEKLKEKGYKLVDLKFRMPEEDINLININKVVEKELKAERISIDYRL